jgi:SAM-dependent methyltransferase
MVHALASRLWPLKIAAKIGLSRLPFDYQVWQRLGLFRLGRMDEASYALRIFRLHAGKAFPDGLPEGFTALELGPGDSVATALIAYAHGAGKMLLVDVGDFARKDLDRYRRIAEHLVSEGLQAAADLSRLHHFEELLTTCRAEYQTNGLDSLRALPDESVNFVWSHSVLEHVRKHEFDATVRETHRILKNGGRASHSVDLMDHLAKSLNNLRFPETVWESEFMANSGFYTNRLRFSQIEDSMTRAGFASVVGKRGRWPELPLPRGKLDRQFRDTPEDDLLTRTAHFLLTK